MFVGAGLLDGWADDVLAFVAGFGQFGGIVDGKLHGTRDLLTQSKPALARHHQCGNPDLRCGWVKTHLTGGAVAIGPKGVGWFCRPCAVSPMLP